MLATCDESFFANLLRAGGVLHEALHELQGLETCQGPDGQVSPGGAVLTLLESSSTVGKEESVLASVACVLSPKELSVWAPKEEVRGMLALLEEEEESKPDH